MKNKNKNKNKKNNVTKSAQESFGDSEGNNLHFFDSGHEMRNASAIAAIAKTDLYFAYGSNMNLDQMQRRCPNAKLVGAAQLLNWKLFSRGVADVAQDKGCAVPGALWRVTSNCMTSLDTYEGFPTYYGREIVEVEVRIGGPGSPLKTVFAWVYSMTYGHKGFEAPMSYSYALGCAQGARDCGTVVHPLFLRDISEGPKERITMISPRGNAQKAPSQSSAASTPDFVKKEIASWCKRNGLDATKAQNLLAFSSYDSTSKEIRISGDGTYVTLKNVKAPKVKNAWVAPKNSLDDYDDGDEVREGFASLLEDDESLLSDAELLYTRLGAEDQRFLDFCREKLSNSTKLLSDDSRHRLEEIVQK